MSTLQKKKGPASVAADPDRGSQSRKGNSNMDSSTTAATDRATVMHHMSRVELRQLSMKHLHSLYEAIDIAAESLQGMICQPRFGDGGASLNPAGDTLDGIIEHLFECRTLIADIAEQSKPTAPDEAEKRAWILLRRGAGYHDHLQDFAALAAQLVAQQAHVEFHACRKAVAA